MEENKDIVFNVMPPDGSRPVGGGAPVPNAPAPQQNYSSSSAPTGGRKWTYIIIALVALVLLGAGAYYMLGGQILGNQQEEQQQTTTKQLPKVWLNQYFNVDTCADKSSCGDDADKDTDGLGNYDEFKAGTNPLNPDTDQDGLADGDEVNIYRTEPSLKFTDKREVVAQNNWTDGFQVKGGYDPLTPGLKFTDSRKQQIQNAITQFKLHEPSITTLGSGSETTQGIGGDYKPDGTYTNSKYGFSLKFPTGWKMTTASSATSAVGETLWAAPATEIKTTFKIESNCCREGYILAKEVNVKIDGKSMIYKVIGKGENLDSTTIDPKKPQRIAIVSIPTNLLKSTEKLNEALELEMVFDVKDQTKALEIYDQILSTFKFIK